jgi:hypothetical protein
MRQCLSLTVVIPAQAGIQYVLDSRLRGNDKESSDNHPMNYSRFKQYHHRFL